VRRFIARLRRGSSGAAETTAVVTSQSWTLPRLTVTAGPETAARLGVPVGTVVRDMRFSDDGELVNDMNLDQEVTP
jgi:hypothetical protein